VTFLFRRALDDKLASNRPGEWALTGGAVSITCPSCGRIGQLDHTVKADGTVSPSLVCPHLCGFHRQGRLEGWVEDV